MTLLWMWFVGAALFGIQMVDVGDKLIKPTALMVALALVWPISAPFYIGYAYWKDR